MHGEFAFIPSVFDQEAHKDCEVWREQLQELGHGMFPRTAAGSVMVSNLYAGAWYETALQTVKSIKDQKARFLCQSLLKKIEGTLVNRPVCGAWPEIDLAWGKEAIKSDAVAKIDRIIACKSVRDALSPEYRKIRDLGEVLDAGFWQGISSQSSIPLKIAEQVDALRKLCLHAEFLCLVTPYVKGGHDSDDDTDFALALIRSTFLRPNGFPPPEVELHTEAPSYQASSDFEERLTSVVQNISDAVRSAMKPNQTVRLVIWPKLLDRFLIAGMYTKLSNGKLVRSPRWGVAMSHIARKPDEDEDRPPTPWSLLTSKQLGDEFNRYRTDERTKPIRNVVIGGVAGIGASLPPAK